MATLRRKDLCLYAATLLYTVVGKPVYTMTMSLLLITPMAYLILLWPRKFWFSSIHGDVRSFGHAGRTVRWPLTVGSRIEHVCRCGESTGNRNCMWLRGGFFLALHDDDDSLFQQPKTRNRNNPSHRSLMWRQSMFGCHRALCSCFSHCSSSLWSTTTWDQSPRKPWKVILMRIYRENWMLSRFVIFLYDDHANNNVKGIPCCCLNINLI